MWGVVSPTERSEGGLTGGLSETGTELLDRLEDRLFQVWTHGCGQLQYFPDWPTFKGGQSV